MIKEGKRKSWEHTVHMRKHDLCFKIHKMCQQWIKKSKNRAMSADISGVPMMSIGLSILTLHLINNIVLRTRIDKTNPRCQGPRVNTKWAHVRSKSLLQIRANGEKWSFRKPKTMDMGMEYIVVYRKMVRKIKKRRGLEHSRTHKRVPAKQARSVEGQKYTRANKLQTKVPQMTKVEHKLNELNPPGIGKPKGPSTCHAHTRPSPLQGTSECNKAFKSKMQAHNGNNTSRALKGGGKE